MMNRLANINLRKALITIGLIILLLFGLTVLAKTIFTVESGTRKIILTAGEATSIADEGLNFKIPFYESTKEVDIKTLKATERGQAASKDLQIVTSAISVNYHYDVSRLMEIYKTTGFDINDRIIAPRIQETLKAVASKYSAEQLITQREKAKSEIDLILKSDLAKYNVIVEDIQLTEFRFSPEFDAAIESKQTEVQKTLKAKNILQRTEIEAQQRIAQAEGEAKAIRIQAEAIQTNGGREYVELKRIEKWDGKMPTYIAGEASNVLLGFNPSAE